MHKTYTNILNQQFLSLDKKYMHIIINNAAVFKCSCCYLNYTGEDNKEIKAEGSTTCQQPSWAVVVVVVLAPSYTLSQVRPWLQPPPPLPGWHSSVYPELAGASDDALATTLLIREC